MESSVFRLCCNQPLLWQVFDCLTLTKIELVVLDTGGSDYESNWTELIAVEWKPLALWQCQSFEAEIYWLTEVQQCQSFTWHQET